jgi:hypothetical protein
MHSLRIPKQATRALTGKRLPSLTSHLPPKGNGKFIGTKLSPNLIDLK